MSYIVLFIMEISEIKYKLNKKILLSSMLILSACSGYSFLDEDQYRHNLSRPDIIDPELQMTRKDYAEGLKPDPLAQLNDDQDLEIAMPDLVPVLSEPPKPNFVDDKLISLTITEEVNVRDVILEIGKLADLNVSIGSNVTGGIILRVKDKPLIDVLDHIADSANLRYHFNKNVLRVEKDSPYLVTYYADFLNLTRSSSGGATINTQVIGGANAGSGGLTSGSNHSLVTNYDGDIWASVENGLRDILGVGGSSDGAIMSSQPVTKERNTSLTMNKNAGIISIIANSKSHKDVEKYLDHISRTSSAQVLIEAKVLEVALDDEYNTGIDWNYLEKGLNMGVDLNFNTNFSAVTNIFKLGGDTKSFKKFIQMAETFGTTRTLSSPRLHAMNNQHAFITFAENKVYFTLNVENEKETEGSVTTNNLKVESNLNTVPIGVILNMQPSINLDTDEITLNVRPTLSRVTSTIEDPAIRITLADAEATAATAGSGSTTLDFSNITSEIPIIEVRELDSVLKIKSGEVMVIGGLMEERVVNTDSGIPYISSIPFIGNAFKSVSRDKRTVETVIFIKASIVPSHGVSKQDQRFYKKYAVDPRPLF